MANLLELSSVKDGTNLSDVVVYISNYKRALKKDGNGYIVGSFSKREESLNFKVWDAPIVDYLSSNDLQGRVVKISGSVSSYLSNLEVKVTAIALEDEVVFPKSLFLKSANVDVIFNEFMQFIKMNLSEKAQKVVIGVLNGEGILARFKEEFAGSKMHDAQIGGLIHHTLKMLKIAKVVVDNEPRFKTIENYNDMLYTSIIFHDVGKIYEMHYGVYQENSFVTHRILGIELLVKYKAAISQLFDENFYYELVAVLQGHHGEFGDPPTTVLAYIVHLIDMLESQTTGIFDKLERNEYTLKAGSMAVLVDKSYLVV